MTSVNPYAAPKAAVADASVVVDAQFVPGGQARPIGHGWSWIAEGWELFKRQPGTWIGIILLMLVVMVGAALIPLLGPIAITLLWPVFIAGFVVGCRALDTGHALEVGHLFAGFRERTATLLAVGGIYLAAYLGIMLVIGLTMGVGMAAMMGQGDSQAMAAMGMTMVLAMLVMFALMLPVVMAVWFAAPLVVFHEHGAIDAMKASFTGCLKNILPFLWYSVVFIVLAVVASLPLMLGWLALGPVLAASFYTAYRDIYLKPR